MRKYPRIHSVAALRGKKLKVTFINGETLVYDCRPLLSEESFKALEDETLFRLAKVEKHGYAVIWNDEIDLAESEIWLHGRRRAARAPRKKSAGSACSGSKTVPERPTRVKHSRLARECAKLDPKLEKALAEEVISERVRGAAADDLKATRTPELRGISHV